MQYPYSDRARTVMQLAQEEAHRFRHEYIGTEHILLGLIRLETGAAFEILKKLGLDLRRIRTQVDKIIQPGNETTSAGKMPQTPRAKRVIEFAIDEARKLKQDRVGTEHLLLGLIREEEGVAALVLMNLGLTLSKIRNELLATLGQPPIPSVETEPAGSELTRHVFRRSTQAYWLLETLIEVIGELKEVAIDTQDFDRAALLRDHQHVLRGIQKPFRETGEQSP